jgi:citrate/tricarballylate utilization protein
MLLHSGPAAFFSRHVGPGAFYQVAPYLAIVIPALAITFYGVAVQASGARQFLRDIGPHPRKILNWHILQQATRKLLLVYWRGGGTGCYDDQRGSHARRDLHFFVFWGVMAALASTTLAYVYQDWFDRPPPYPLLSMPMLLGVFGGVGIVIGATGMLVRKGTSFSVPTSPQMVAMDVAFIVLLDVVALTGILLLALRSTSLMGLPLAIHLGVVASLFLTAPYGKLVHAV